MSGWQKYTFEDVCRKIYSGGTPSTKHAEYWNGTINWLSSGETGNRFIYDTERKITELGVKKSATKKAYKGNTVVASAGQGYTRGQASYLTIDTYVNQSVIVFDANTDIIDSKFLFYNLSSRYEELRQLSDGTSTRGGLSGWIVKRMEINLPPLTLQKQIVDILFTIDEKIEINKAINKNLEQQAQAIFKSQFENTEMKVVKFGDIATFKYGKMPKKDRITTIGYPLFSGYQIVGYYPEKMFDKPQIIVVARGGGCGDIKYTPSNCYLTNLSIAILLNDNCYEDYIFRLLKNTDMTILNTGSAQPQITVDSLQKFELCIPTEKEAKVYSDIIQPIKTLYRKNNVENQNLATLRDTLLPKLMNGEIDVSAVKV